MITFPDSYRWRLLSISLLTGGLSLIVFGWFSWKQIYVSKESTLDLQLQNFSTRYGGKLFSLTTPEHAFQSETNASQLNEILELSGFVSSTIDLQGNTIWSSEQWPKTLGIEDYAVYGSDEDPVSFPRPGPLPPGAPVRGLRPPSNRQAFPPPLSNLTTAASQKPALEAVLKFEHAFFADVTDNKEKYRLYILPIHRGVIVVAASKQQLNAEMRMVLLSYLLAFPVSTLLIILGAVFLGNQALRPVKKLIVSAESIDGNQLKGRIESQGSSKEFAQLIDVYNRMLDRLETSFNQAKRFSADAAHELNTPLTILRGNLENALQEAPNESEEQKTYGSLLEDVNTLISIVHKLLTLSRMDSGSITPELKIFSISNMAETILEDAELFFQDLKLIKQIDPNLYVNADPAWVRQILHNLFSNAGKYNLPRGWVEITLRKEKEYVELVVSNSAENIPPQAEKQLFDRFFRIPKDRSSSQKSLGLGLSLSKEFTTLLKGSLTLKKNSENTISFSLKLPIHEATGHTS